MKSNYFAVAWRKVRHSATRKESQNDGNGNRTYIIVHKSHCRANNHEAIIHLLVVPILCVVSYINRFSKCHCAEHDT